MAKKSKVKKHHTKSSPFARLNKLEQPVHNIIGYGVLLILSVITLFLVLRLSVAG